MKILDENTLATLKAGLGTPFWDALVKSVLEPDIEKLTHSILEDDTLSESGQVSKRDLARFWLRVLKSLRDLPGVIGKQEGKTSGAEQAERFDPYATVEDLDREWNRVKK